RIDCAQPVIDRRARWRNLVDGGEILFSAAARQGNDIIRFSPTGLRLRAARGCIGIERRLFISRAATKNISQLKKNDHRRDEKEYRAKIKKFHTLCRHL